MKGVPAFATCVPVLTPIPLVVVFVVVIVVAVCVAVSSVAPTSPRPRRRAPAAAQISECRDPSSARRAATTAQIHRPTLR